MRMFSPDHEVETEYRAFLAAEAALLVRSP